MYGKLLEFLRVSSLDPEFLIKCPDPENFFPHEQVLKPGASAGQNFRIPPQRLTRIPASVAEGGVVGQEFPRVRARAALTHADPMCARRASRVQG